jgi:hypothetical protein
MSFLVQRARESDAIVASFGGPRQNRAECVIVSIGAQVSSALCNALGKVVAMVDPMAVPDGSVQ